VMLCEENTPNFGGQVSDFSTTTTLPPTQHWVCDSFSRKTGWRRFRTPTPFLPSRGTQRFFPVSKNEEEVRGKNDGGTEGYHFARVPELFWAMEKAVGWVYCFSRRVFWRWLSCGNVQRNIRFF
jgi:hypothetical protein